MPKKVLAISHQGMFESRRLWEKVTQAIQRPEGPDWKTVQIEKSKLGRKWGRSIHMIEEAQRKLPCHQPESSPCFQPWKLKHFEEIPHQGKGVMKTGYRFKYFDLSAVQPV